MKPFSKIKFIGSFVALFVLFLAVALISTANADVTGTRAKTISSTPSDITIAAVGATASADYISPIYTADFAFNGVGLSWAGTATNVEFWLKVDEHNWQHAEMVGDETKDQAEPYISQPAFINGSTVQYKITGSDVAQVQNVRVTYFDSTVPPSTSPLRTIAANIKRSIQTTASSALTVISRADWGADESWRFWDPEYATPTKFIVHHTAGGDGGVDPAATIRGVYYWQSTVLGWGDIGYNYIIDPAGNIYEGRHGGDGVIGGHAYNSDTNTNFNVGSIGIVLLGCYEDTPGECDTINTITPDMQNSLVNLVANKAAKFGIDPTGSSDWLGVHVDNVIGHRDVDATDCPGNTVESGLSDIRTAAGVVYQTLSVTGTDYQATWSNNNFASSYSSTDTPDITVEYTNNGTKKWKTDNVHLQVAVKGKNKHQKINLPSTTDTNQAADFTFTWTNLPQHSGDFTMVTKLYHSGTMIAGSRHKTSVSITNPYQAAIVSTDLPTAIKQGWIPTVHLTVTNTGTIDWDTNTIVQVNGASLGTLQNPVVIGKNHTFTFTIPDAAAWPVGTQSIVIKLMNGTTPIAGSRSIAVIRID